MEKMNEIKNEKRLTKYVEDIHGSHYALGCEKCPLNINSCDYVCDDVLADRLAKYEDIGRDFMNLHEGEVVPVEALEMSFKVSSVLAIVSEHNKLAKAVFDSVLGTIDKLYGKKNKDKHDESRKNK